MIIQLYKWYGKRTVIVIALVILLLIGTGIFLTKNISKVVETEPILRTVTVSKIKSLSNTTSIELIGSVEAIHQAQIEAEAGGRVTSVSVALGDTVIAGEVIAQLENTSERAAVLQAQGAYEATEAAAAQSDSSIVTSEITLQNARIAGDATYRNSYTTLDDIIRNTADIVFGDIDFPIPVFRLSGSQNAVSLNRQRIQIESVLDAWAKNIANDIYVNNTRHGLENALKDTNVIGSFIEELSSAAFENDNDDTVVEGVPITTFRTQMTIARTNVNAVRTRIKNAITAIENAKETLTRSTIAGTNSDLSTANAQLKQALGALRATQANLAKTILRTPISGTVNMIDIKIGDYVGLFTRVATVANNSALEITTFVGESDRTKLSIGDTVTISNKYKGTITNIAPAIDSATKKVEVLIQTTTDALANGDTVRISITPDDTNTKTDERILVPLTAVKFNATDGSVLVVTENVVQALPVKLGKIYGSNVEMLEGVTALTEIIIDARGINVGQEVDPQILN